jgi:hypothetical protein
MTPIYIFIIATFGTSFSQTLQNKQHHFKIRRQPYNIVYCNSTTKLVDSEQYPTQTHNGYYAAHILVQCMTKSMECKYQIKERPLFTLQTIRDHFTITAQPHEYSKTVPRQLTSRQISYMHHNCKDGVSNARPTQNCTSTTVHTYDWKTNRPDDVARAAALYIQFLLQVTSDLAGDRTVRFNEPMCEIHEITPYSEIYGLHPNDFVFDKFFNILPANPLCMGIADIGTAQRRLQSIVFRSTSSEGSEDDNSSSDEELGDVSHLQQPFDEHSIWRAETRHHTNDTISHYVTRTNLLTDNPSLSNSEWLSGVRPMPDTNDPTPRHGAQPTSDVQADCAPSAVQKDHEFQLSEQFQVHTSKQFPQFQILANEPRFQSLESQFEEAIDSQFQFSELFPVITSEQLQQFQSQFHTSGSQDQSHNIHMSASQFQNDTEQVQSRKELFDEFRYQFLVQNSGPQLQYANETTITTPPLRNPWNVFQERYKDQGLRQPEFRKFYFWPQRKDLERHYSEREAVQQFLAQHRNDYTYDFQHHLQGDQFQIDEFQSEQLPTASTTISPPFSPAENHIIEQFLQRVQSPDTTPTVSSTSKHNTEQHHTTQLLRGQQNIPTPLEASRAATTSITTAMTTQPHSIEPHLTWTPKPQLSQEKWNKAWQELDKTMQQTQSTTEHLQLSIHTASNHNKPLIATTKVQSKAKQRPKAKQMQHMQYYIARVYRFLYMLMHLLFGQAMQSDTEAANVHSTQPLQATQLNNATQQHYYQQQTGRWHRDKEQLQRKEGNKTCVFKSASYESSCEEKPQIAQHNKARQHKIELATQMQANETTSKRDNLSEATAMKSSATHAMQQAATAANARAAIATGSGLRSISLQFEDDRESKEKERPWNPDHCPKFAGYPICIITDAYTHCFMVIHVTFDFAMFIQEITRQSMHFVSQALPATVRTFSSSSQTSMAKRKIRRLGFPRQEYHKRGHSTRDMERYVSTMERRWGSDILITEQPKFQPPRTPPAINALNIAFLLATMSEQSWMLAAPTDRSGSPDRSATPRFVPVKSAKDMLHLAHAINTCKVEEHVRMRYINPDSAVVPPNYVRICHGTTWSNFVEIGRNRWQLKPHMGTGWRNLAEKFGGLRIPMAYGSPAFEEDQEAYKSAMTTACGYPQALNRGQIYYGLQETYDETLPFLVVMDYHVHPDNMLLTRESSNQIGFMTYADYMIFEGASIVPRAAQFPQQPKFVQQETFLELLWYDPVFFPWTQNVSREARQRQRKIPMEERDEPRHTARCRKIFQDDRASERLKHPYPVQVKPDELKFASSIVEARPVPPRRNTTPSADSSFKKTVKKCRFLNSFRVRFCERLNLVRKQPASERSGGYIIPKKGANKDYSEFASKVRADFKSRQERSQPIYLQPTPKNLAQKVSKDEQNREAQRILNANIQEQALERRRQIADCMDFSKTEAESFGSSTREEEDPDERANKKARLMEQQQELSEYLATANRSRDTELATVVARAYMRMMAGGKCKNPRCFRPPYALHPKAYCCTECGRAGRESETFGTTHCTTCNEVWGGVKAWVLLQSKPGPEREALLREAAADRFQDYNMGILYEISQKFAEVSKFDNAQAPMEVNSDDSQRIDNLFSLLEDRPIYPPSSQDAEAEEEGTRGGSGHAGKADEDSAARLRKFAVKILKQSNQPVTKETVEEMIAVNEEKSRQQRSRSSSSTDNPPKWYERPVQSSSSSSSSRQRVQPKGETKKQPIAKRRWT